MLLEKRQRFSSFDEVPMRFGRVLNRQLCLECDSLWAAPN